MVDFFSRPPGKTTSGTTTTTTTTSTVVVTKTIVSKPKPKPAPFPPRAVEKVRDGPSSSKKRRLDSPSTNGSSSKSITSSSSSRKRESSSKNASSSSSSSRPSSSKQRPLSPSPSPPPAPRSRSKPRPRSPSPPSSSEGEDDAALFERLKSGAVAHSRVSSRSGTPLSPARTERKMKPSQLGGNAGGVDKDGLPSFVRKGKGGDGKRAGEKGGGGSRGSWAGLIHSADLVGEDIKNYKPFFEGEGVDPDKPVTVELEYPAVGASERFLLLTNRNGDDEYEPIMEIVKIVRTVLENFIPLPTSASLSLPPTLSAMTASSPLPSNPASPSASSSPQKTNNPGVAPPPNPTPTQILRLLTRSTAPNVLSLPQFLLAISQYNRLIVGLRESGEVSRCIEEWEGGTRDAVWRVVNEQVYQRVVGPKMEDLKDYLPFSSNVYGELLPPFLSHLLTSSTLLNPPPSSTSTILDLGSGVGNCVLQAALQLGCPAYGCEQLKGPAGLARGQVREARRRWAVWGVAGWAGEIKTWEGDFLEHEGVRELVPRADVVIANNYAFSSQLNEKLSLLFLDLKEGAQIISLRPFVPPDFRLTERTCSSPQAILSCQEHRFQSQAVSWTHEGGLFYVHKVDRKPLQKYLAEQAGGGSGRPSSSRRSSKRG